MTSESLICHESLQKGALRKSNVKSRASLYGSSWAFSKDIHLTTELLAEVGVGVLDDDDSNSNSSLNSNRSTKVKRETKKASKRQHSLVQLEPTPPGSNTSCTAPPKNKHHRNDISKKQHNEDQTPFKMRRRTRADSPTADGNYLERLMAHLNHHGNLHLLSSSDAFANISDEMVLQIFKWLPKTMLVNCARTCKRWKLIAYDHSLWTRLNLGEHTLVPDTLRHVLGRGVVTLRLAKADIQEPQDIVLSMPSPIIENERFCKLRHLDLSMAVVSKPVLEGILSVCNKLVNLSLEHCDLNDNICRYLGRNVDLEKLNLAMCSGLTGPALESLFTECTKITSLNLAWANLSLAAVDAAIANMPTYITHLNLSGCRQTLTDEHIQDLVMVCDELLELDLSDAVGITSVSVRTLVRHLLYLESLSLTRCYGISKASILTLQHCEKLRQLQIFGLFGCADLSSFQTSLKGVAINKKPFSDIARPTTGVSVTSIWGLRVRN